MQHKNYREIVESFLLNVEMPGQYVGGEWNSIKSNESAASDELLIALAFPDSYSVGMSHHGLRILYELLNDMDGIRAERAFAPLPDMEKEMRERNVPVWTLESFTPLSECDVVGFSLQYELCATNLLTMLDLSGIALHSHERSDDTPLIIAGGAGTFNPESLADFIDLFLIGDGEEAFPELLSSLAELKKENLSRDKMILELVKKCPGWYAPSLYKYPNNTNEQDVYTGAPKPVSDIVPEIVERRIVADLESIPHPVKPVVPVVQTAHERVTLEIMRGCPNGCRFCHAGITTRPVRPRSVESLCEAARKCYAATGYDELGLLSLSTSDYPQFTELVEKLDSEFADKGVGISLPSLRVDTALSGIPQKVKSVRKGSFTIAPEAATERLRRVINKHVTDSDLFDGSAAAYRAGWKAIKLYFMIGLPTETDEDVKEIGRLANKVAKLRQGRRGGTAVTLSVSNFVPKAHTPFQWFGMDTEAELKRKQDLVASEVDRRLVSYKAHGTSVSILEGLFARGDRSSGKVLLEAWRAGARFDAWSEHHKSDVWQQAQQIAGIDAETVAGKSYDESAPLPWDHISSGVSRKFLANEWKKSQEESMTAPCSEANCAVCGVNGCLFMRKKLKESE